MPMNLTEVILEEGKVIHRQEELTAEYFETRDGRCPILSKTPVDLTITNQGDHVLRIEGSTSLTVGIPCARCLEQTEVPLDISFDLEADMKLSEEDRTEALDECVFLHGYNLDVDRLVYGEALLVWPMQVLCREDCRGLCRVCGQNLNRGNCGCDQTVPDPRLAKIRDIFQNFKEV